MPRRWRHSSHPWNRSRRLTSGRSSSTWHTPAWKQAANADELAAGNRFQTVIAEQPPIVPLVVRNSIWVFRPIVDGWLPHQYDIYLLYNNVWLSQ